MCGEESTLPLKTILISLNLIQFLWNLCEKADSLKLLKRKLKSWGGGGGHCRFINSTKRMNGAKIVSRNILVNQLEGFVELQESEILSYSAIQ